MIGEQMESFIDGLTEKTRHKKIDWRPLTTFDDYSAFEREASTVFSRLETDKFDYILDESSYYFEHGEGYIVLCNVALIKCDTKVQHEELYILTKPNRILPLTDAGNFPAFRVELEKLKLLIECNIDDSYPLPDTWYRYWNNILSED